MDIKTLHQLQIDNARAAFQNDDQFSRDREKYGKFESMPLNLQMWWVDRAAYLRRVATVIS